MCRVVCRVLRSSWAYRACVSALRYSFPADRRGCGVILRLLKKETHHKPDPWYRCICASELYVCCARWCTQMPRVRVHSTVFAGWCGLVFILFYFLFAVGYHFLSARDFLHRWVNGFTTQAGQCKGTRAHRLGLCRPAVINLSMVDHLPLTCCSIVFGYFRQTKIDCAYVFVRRWVKVAVKLKC